MNISSREFTALDTIGVGKQFIFSATTKEEEAIVKDFQELLFKKNIKFGRTSFTFVNGEFVIVLEKRKERI